MVVCVVALEDWVRASEARVLTSVLNDDGSVWCCIDETAALDLANSPVCRTDVSGATPNLLALVLDETFTGAPDPERGPEPRHSIKCDQVTEVRYLRCDPAGVFRSMETRAGLAELLDLLPHPEGGWYRETWASSVSFAPPGYDGERATATAIYFLLPAGTGSCWHQLRSDEIWLWHRGGPLELGLGGTGASPCDPRLVTLGPDVEAGHQPQVLVPRGTWQTARPAGAEEVLVSTIVSPGFAFADFRVG